jgi:hypothetical protein
MGQVKEWAGKGQDVGKGLHKKGQDVSKVEENG